MPLRYNMAEMNWVSLQFYIHILYNDRRTKFIEASKGIREKKLLEASKSPCNESGCISIIQLLHRHKLRLICRKQSHDAARQVETPSKRTIFVPRHNYHVTSVLTSCCSMTAKQENDIVCSLWADLGEALF